MFVTINPLETRTLVLFWSYNVLEWVSVFGPRPFCYLPYKPKDFQYISKFAKWHRFNPIPVKFGQWPFYNPLICCAENNCYRHAPSDTSHTNFGILKHFCTAIAGKLYQLQWHYVNLPLISYLWFCHLVITRKFVLDPPHFVPSI